MQIKKGAHLVILKKNIFILQNIENLVNYNEIETVAYQCPMAGGNAVFRARAIYSLMNENAEYDDQFICLQQGIV